MHVISLDHCQINTSLPNRSVRLANQWNKYPGCKIGNWKCDVCNIFTLDIHIYLFHRLSLTYTTYRMPISTRSDGVVTHKISSVVSWREFWFGTVQTVGTENQVIRKGIIDFFFSEDTHGAGGCTSTLTRRSHDTENYSLIKGISLMIPEKYE